MYREINNVDIDNFADDREIDFDFIEDNTKDDGFIGLAFTEVKYLCKRIKLSKTNSHLILLHCRGFSDTVIASKINKHFEQNLTPKQIRQRRFYHYHRMELSARENLGIITVLREVLKRRK